MQKQNVLAPVGALPELSLRTLRRTFPFLNQSAMETDKLVVRWASLPHSKTAFPYQVPPAGFGHQKMSQLLGKWQINSFSSSRRGIQEDRIWKITQCNSTRKTGSVCTLPCGGGGALEKDGCGASQVTGKCHWLAGHFRGLLPLQLGPFRASPHHSQKPLSRFLCSLPLQGASLAVGSTWKVGG